MRGLKVKLYAPPVVEQRVGSPTWYGQLVSGVTVLYWALDTLVKAVNIV